MGEDVGDGSVDRRRVGGFRVKSSSGVERLGDPWTLRLGRGDGRNSSIRSVSGTGSILIGAFVDAVLVTLSRAGPVTYEGVSWTGNRMCGGSRRLFQAAAEVCLESRAFRWVPRHEEMARASIPRCACYRRVSAMRVLSRGPANRRGRWPFKSGGRKGVWNAHRVECSGMVMGMHPALPGRLPHPMGSADQDTLAGSGCHRFCPVRASFASRASGSGALSLRGNGSADQVPTTL